MSRGFTVLFRAALVFMALPVVGFGGLSWKNRQIELVAKAGEKQLTGVFAFTNSGSTAITIIEVHASCGCTAVELPKRTYAPGEGGEITAVYTAGDAKGKQSKSIQVTTNEPSSKPVELTLQVTIPDEIVYSPRMLLWRIGDKLDEKTVVINTPTTRKIEKIDIQSINPEKEAIARLVSSPAGSISLLVRPTSVFKASQVAITCVATFTDGGTELLTVYSLVK